MIEQDRMTAGEYRHQRGSNRKEEKSGDENGVVE